ncbi:hypothetical protein PCANC_02946 [Puccinia coronata f. sp. avenae]|uniref:No apical meristem-associated C-terminal domain-containing protein n=1 Tax=Puccinia coronata f. sp. avenae TaxID=200324 RepID=A0A2N5T8J6_9BASI|nr:hypothetical protein PCANC_02946 [Puccinia coronata f. sp. avenae]
MTTAKSRTSNFTPTEDKHLARSWSQVSQDPLTNNSQKRDTFWETITRTFNARTGSSRKTKSLMNRWDAIRKRTLKFGAIYHKIREYPPSGTTETNHLKLAKEAYYNKVSKLFIFETAWDVLKDLDKWRQSRSKSQKNVANTSTQSQPAPTSNPPSSNAPLSTPNFQNGTSEPNSEEPVRPIGIKRAKQQAASEYASKKKLQLLEKNTAKGQRRSKQMSEASAIQTETNKIQKCQADAKQALANIKIMDKDLATVTDEWLHEYFLKRKKRIVEDLRKREIEEAEQAEKDAAEKAKEAEAIRGQLAATRGQPVATCGQPSTNCVQTSTTRGQPTLDDEHDNDNELSYHLDFSQLNDSEDAQSELNVDPD